MVLKARWNFFFTTFMIMIRLHHQHARFDRAVGAGPTLMRWSEVRFLPRSADEIGRAVGKMHFFLTRRGCCGLLAAAIWVAPASTESKIVRKINEHLIKAPIHLEITMFCTSDFYTDMDTSLFATMVRTLWAFGVVTDDSPGQSFSTLVNFSSYWPAIWEMHFLDDNSWFRVRACTSSSH